MRLPPSTLAVVRRHFAGEVDQVVHSGLTRQDSATLVANRFQVGQPVEFVQIAGHRSEPSDQTIHVE